MKKRLPTTELPTILTYIEHDPRSSSWPKLEYGIDFNLSYGIGTSKWVNLTQGENSFDNSPLKILFEVQKENYSLDDGYLQTQVCYSRKKTSVFVVIFILFFSFSNLVYTLKG